ncbi:DNA/RNA non-specific endonuclease [Achromobacter xylosoxidans]
MTLSFLGARRLLTAALLAAGAAHAALPSPAQPQDLAGFKDCPQHFFQGAAPVPFVGSAQNPGKLRALCFDGFAVLHSGEAKTPVYVAEFISRESLRDAKGQKRTNRFYEEARLPASERARLADYRGSGYDRGHMAAAGQRNTPESMAQSFSLANMVPQAPENNQGAWRARVEEPTRKYAARSVAGIYVITGPIHSPPVATIGAGKVWVPSKLFKLVYDPQSRRAWAYLVDNTDTAKVGTPLSYDQLVQHLGIHLLPATAFQK